MVAGTPAQAATGQRFLPASLTRMELIRLVHVAQARDPSGHAKLMPQECVHDRNACATAYDYFDSYRQLDPDSGLTDVSQLEGYLSSLADGDAPTDGEYIMACLVSTGAPGMYRTDVSCTHRAFHKGEKVSYNPRTKRIVLAWDCKNPVGGRWEVTAVAPPPCAYIVVDTASQDTLRRGVLIPHGTAMHDEHHCLGVKFPGDVAFRAFDGDNCPDHNCGMEKYARLAGLALAHYGSDKSSGGKVIIRVPSYFTNQGEVSEVDLCLKKADGRQTCGQRIGWASYTLVHDDATGEVRETSNAYVTYKGNGSTDKPGVDWTWHNPVNCPDFF